MKSSTFVRVLAVIGIAGIVLGALLPGMSGF